MGEEDSLAGKGFWERLREWRKSRKQSEVSRTEADAEWNRELQKTVAELYEGMTLDQLEDPRYSKDYDNLIRVTEARIKAAKRGNKG